MTPTFENIKKSLHVFLEYCEKRKTSIRVLSFFFVLSLITLYILLPPANFPAGRIITIDEGATLSEIVEQLHEKDLIRSKTVFKVIVMAQPGTTGVLAGDYFFEYPLDVGKLARKFTQGRYGLDPVRITIHEGLDIYQVAESFAIQFEKFNKEHFIELAAEKEGYLFPDTYLFLPNVKEDQVIQEMEDNFKRRITSIQDELDKAEKDLHDIIIMASIIEKEAWKENDQKLISGVLWKRLEIGMMLQVDSTFSYINGKNTYELTYDDLAIDSPYNTYKHTGLPAGPIANPGLGAILAAINPEISSYLFYLADMKGNTYYAETYAGHLRNKALYMQ